MRLAAFVFALAMLSAAQLALVSNARAQMPPDARAQIVDTEDFSVERLPERVRATVLQARAYARAAEDVAVAARANAERAEAAALRADRYEAGTIITNDQATGETYRGENPFGREAAYGVTTSTAGRRFAGVVSDGFRIAGPGVYRPVVARDGAYYMSDLTGSQFGPLLVAEFEIGYRYSGQYADGAPRLGVLEGREGGYEGGVRFNSTPQQLNIVREGLGVVWGPNGEPIMAGRFENGVMVEAFR
jgi:hypothetical protein